VPKDLGYTEQALAQLAGALLRAGQGTPGEAKAKLSRALKTVHLICSNYQLLSAVLNSIAPLHYDAHDVAGAQQMLASSLALSKTGGDVAAQAATAAVTDQVFARLGDDAHRGPNAAYLARKRAEWTARAAAATGGGGAEAHAALLAWGLEA